MNVRFLSPAEEEIGESADYYFGESPQAASAFLDEIDRATVLIGQNPKLYPVYSDDVRVKQLDHFPFSIFYRIDEGEAIIQSVAHNSRKPDFWKNRL
ncbi:MAG TPA: type II toxin-antitoxin system RelE/ParE family toxin [Candidatus Kapabacteria bacterium]|nr:type II toxin-antitoxin system RelE/ParE family toxin [Candidatus Kapabacteria bacterium]